MPEDGSTRPHLIGRLLIAIGRAAALLILVTGIYGALAIALPRTPPLPRSIAALVGGVIIFELLRPRKRQYPADVDEAHNMIDSLHAEAESLRSESETQLDSVRREIEKLTEVNDALRQQIDRSESTIEGLNDELSTVRDLAAEEARSRATEGEQARTREKQIREQYEAESKNIQHAASKALEEIQRTRASSDELRGQLERERARASGLQQSADALDAQRKKLELQLADFDARLASSLQELDGLRADRQRARRELEEARQKMEVEKSSLRTSMDAEWSAKLQKMVSELAADHENDIGDAIAAREAARAEVRSLTSRVHELQKELDLLRKSSQQLLHANEALTEQLDEERQRSHGTIQKLTTDHQTELQAQLQRERQLSHELATTRERIEEENASLKAQLEERPVVDEKALRQRIDNEWSAKLQKIVTELTMDHENDIGDAIAARETARAEARALTIHVQELGKQLQSARDSRLGLLQRDDEISHELERLKTENAKLKGQTVDEKAIRDKVEAEWSEKLQTIVSHITSDHESDLGKSIEEREAARAEVRNMAIKLNALQQKLDADRQSFTAAQDKWNSTRDELQTQLRDAEAQIASLRVPSSEEAPFSESIPEAENEEEQRARANVLEFAEQAHAALQRIASPEERKARILFVHHDPALRALWRDNLGKSGFDVHTAVDGLEGLRLAKAEKPDVVIADASMPKMDGRELCRLIKSSQETAAVKVILMTGIYTTETPMDASGTVEADEMLRKPVKLDAMKTALSNLLTAKV